MELTFLKILSCKIVTFCGRKLKRMLTIYLLLQRTKSITYKTNGTTCLYEFKFIIEKKELTTLYCNNGKVNNFIAFQRISEKYHKLGLDILNIIHHNDEYNFFRFSQMKQMRCHFSKTMSEDFDLLVASTRIVVVN
jgi:hypothetical protein